MSLDKISLAAWLGLVALAQFGGSVHAQDRPPSVVTNSIYYRRWLWHHQDRELPGHNAAAAARLKALQQIEASKQSSLFVPAAIVPGNAWAPIGPAPIFNGQTSGSQPVSGRIGDIAVNPSNYNHWVIGTAQGGVWITFNAGVSWKALTDDQASLAFGAVTFAASATNIIYAGTGEEVFSGDATSGAGLLKSINGGATWQLLAAATFRGTTFSTIRVHPTDPNVLLASTASGIYKSINGGVNWTLKRSGTGTDIEVDSGNFTNQYCAIGNTGGSAANGIYRSINLGETWTLVTGPWSSMSFVGRIELAISPSSPATLYVSIANSSTSGLLGIWRADNAWDPTPVWMQLPDPGSGFGSMWYNHEVIVDPANPNILYAGGNGLKKYNGSSWTDVLGTMHVDQHALAWAGPRLIVGNDGGVWSTTTGGASYVNHNSNLQLTQFYHGSISPSDPNFALGGSQDNGTARWNGTNGWHLILGGDGADNAISSANPTFHWAASFQDLEIRRTRNAGASFDDATTGIGASGRPFICRFEKAPHNDDIFITGTTTIWKTTNFFTGSTVAWTANSPDFGAAFRSVAFARSDAADNTYACGFSGGPMRITTDGGATWRDLDPLNNVPSRSIYDLAFNPTNANILYVCVNGLSGGTPANVYKTANALAGTPSWSNVSYPADVPANSIAMDQDDPNILYVGTDIGVWKTANGGANWTHMGPEVGMPNVEVDELRLNNTTGRLVAFTHGRGAFALTQANTSDLELTQTDNSDPASVGCPVIYTLTLANRGPSDASGVFVTNRAPDGTIFNSASASQGTLAQNGSTIVFNLGSVPLSSNATMTVVLTPVAAGTLTNQATAKAVQTDPVAANNISIETTLVVVDTGGPQLVSAAAQSDGNSILLTFTEAVSPASATDPANYSLIDGLSNAVSISSIQLGPAQGTVTLNLPLLTHVGPFFLTVRNVQDCAGNPMPSNVVTVVSLPAFTLVGAGSFWKYLDTGVNQGTGWRGPAFDDSGWSSGQAQLGYGDGDEKTVISYGPDPNAKYITYYFRHAFVVPDVTVLTNLVVNLLRDDGGVVYINGTEVFRSNMPGGTVAYSTLASATVNVPDESAFFPGNVSTAVLTNGANVIAVEIHQASPTSSDISFDLVLTANLKVIATPPVFLQQPESQTVLVGDTVTFNASVSGTPPLGYEWLRASTVIVPYSQGLPTLTLTNVQLTNAGTYRLVVTNLARPSGVVSANAVLTVLLDTDGDRMPDVWEAAYGFDTNNPADAMIDSDLDGYTNLQEYLAGTDPRDPQSYLRVDEITADAGGVSLRFIAASNRTYSVLHRSAAESGPWFKLTDLSARTTNSVQIIFDPSPGASRRFYRLVTPRQP